jgi:hypothetical protein
MPCYFLCAARQQEETTMTRINFNSARGTSKFERTVSTVVFAGILIVCSVAVGCSSEKPKTQTMNQPAAQPAPTVAVTPTSTAAPTEAVAAKPVRKRVVRKVPATVTYADESTGVSFQYPRKYSLKTGENADKLVSSDAVPMNFVQPGGVALAVVSVPESAYPKSDLAAAFFDISANKVLTEEQCGEFPAVQTKTVQGKAETASDAAVQPAPKASTKVMIGEMELQSSETLTNDGTREEAAKYYHAFRGGKCYEFALKVATGVETDEGGKRVDREEIFKRLETILATVKINPVATPEVTASAPVVVPVSPAQ